MHASAGAARLVTPFDGRLKLELLRCLIREDLDRIDLVVAFMNRSGLDLIANHLDDALERGACIRLLTTDYLQFTDPGALGYFLDRLDSDAPGRLEARVFSDESTGFHPKAYIFSSSATGEGVAFVGSSNLTRSGITTGIEWNLETRSTSALMEEFDSLWNDPRSTPLTQAWLSDYEARHRERVQADGVQPDVAEPELLADGEDAAPTPWSVQREALAALAATRLDGHQAGLVVMATGLGKTWLAAFDSTRPEFRRVLFVAHRDEILRQSRDVYRQIRPGGSLTLFTGDERDPGGDVVFASVQSLHRNLARFDPDEFDYVVIDEFHHAAADTYRRVLAHFQPRFLLGLTATPHRGDNADLLALCSDNLVYDCDLVEGVGRELLSPFRYRAIPDVADYEHIPWRNGRFDTDELTRHIATRERAQQVLDEWSASGGGDRRALGFCCSIAHADFMADFFRRAGVDAVAVHSGGSSSPRAESLEQLEFGLVSVVFTVDLFNEGVDVPAIDLVMKLRPTESAVVFLQQLGRGLRRADGKDGLDVVDLVGNHRGFLLKARLLAELAGRRHLTNREAVDFLSDRSSDLADGVELPPGCSIVVDPTAVDLLRELAGPSSSRDRLIELIREWVDDHDGARPTALEMTLVTGQPFRLKQQRGWFGLLSSIGLLSAEERRVFDLTRDFLVSIEHGSYTKSYKLVTLLAMLQSGALRGGAPVTDIAATCRWMILRDSNLLADLSDASSFFEDPTDPTPGEWEPYWRTNPIAALTGKNTRSRTWFELVDGRLTLTLAVPDDLGDTFDAMMREIVEYRLHRYLAGKEARRVGEVRRPMRDGVEVDATFVVESTGGAPTSVVIESAGGTRGSDNARNTDYVAGFDLVLERLRSLGSQLLDAYIDTATTADLSVADRRLDPGDGIEYPIDLAYIENLQEMRRSLLRSMTRVGRSPGSKGGGNARKRTRLVIAPTDDWTAVALANAVAAGDSEVVTRASGSARASR